MKTIEEIIKALRCTSALIPEYNCPGCPYRRLEKVVENIPIKEDVVIDGEKYWEIYDVDQIAIDAANMLEGIWTFLKTAKSAEKNSSDSGEM